MGTLKVDKTKAKIVDTSFSHQSSIAMLGSKYIEWIHEFDSDPDDTIFFTDLCTIFVEKIPCKYKVAMLIDPEVIIGEAYKYIRKYHRNFHYVLTHDRQLLDMLGNKGLWFPPSTTWIKNRGVYEKNKHASMFASTKRSTPKQIFRCDIADHLGRYFDQVDVFGILREHELEFKDDGLRDYMFSIVVENSDVPDYFSEKILDCFATGTVPIYNGMKNIGNYFDANGIITFDTIGELEIILNNLSYYAYLKRENSIMINFDIVNRYLISTDDFIFKSYPGLFKEIK